MSAAAGICVVTAAKTLVLAATAFTLSWTHSVEKIRWTEHWALTKAGFVVEQASVEGSGAGMDPPDGSRFIDGKWVYEPKVPPLDRVVLAASGATVGGWRLCAAGRCTVVGKTAQKPIVIKRCDERKK